MVEYKAIVPPYIAHPQPHYYFQEVLRNGCSYYNNSWDNSLNTRKRRKSSTNSNIRTINKRLKKKVLFFIIVSFWKVILTCVSKGIIQCVKSYGAFIDISEDVGLLHISEISHVRVTFMEALFAFGEKVKVSFLQIKSASHCYNDYFYT
ncbi:unnamed protein product [Sphagnum jensenii]|uniref:S1 motif domain-containing protein n=1 Tax=Sphagnum jensenii TaxID=128206 RepID=A0ABP0W7I2_9BRYO